MSKLSLAYLPLSSFGKQSAEWRAGVMCCAAFSDAPPAQVGAADIPCVQVATPLLPPAEEALCEVWCTDQPLTYGKSGSIVYSLSEHLLFGAIDLDENDFAEAPATTPLYRASEVAFREIFSLLDEHNFPYLLRVWNYFPDINRESDGLERYRQFNSGRQEGFQSRKRALEGNVPAACALGSASGHLTIYFLAGRTEPIAIENPRQVSAYHYPQEYGPRSPTFSRANLCRIGEQELLFVSGTASIVGHRSEHLGDVVAQTRETMANIRTVLDEANRIAQHTHFTLRDLLYKVYVRHPADLEAIRRELHAILGEDAQLIYLRADVCREELLVEIEASAGHRTEFL